MTPAERNDMAEDRSSLSNASSYAEIGEYWDSHDLAEHWDQTHEVAFEVEHVGGESSAK